MSKIVDSVKIKMFMSILWMEKMEKLDDVENYRFCEN